MSQAEEISEKLTNLENNFWLQLEAENYDAAESTCKEMSEVPQGAFLTNYCSGHLSFSKKHFSEAVKQLEIASSVTERDDLKALSNYWLGEIYTLRYTYNPFEKNSMHDEELGQKYYLQSISYETFPTEAVNKLLIYFFRHPEASINILNRAISIYPDILDYYVILSRIYAEKFDDPHRALEVLLDADKNQDIKEAEFAYIIAKALFSVKEYDRAKIFYDKAVDLVGDNDWLHARILYEYGNLYIIQENYVQAFHNFNESSKLAISKEITSLYAYTVLAQVYSVLQDESLFNLLKLIEDINVENFLYFNSDMFGSLIMNDLVEDFLNLSFDKKVYIEKLKKISNFPNKRVESKCNFLLSTLYNLTGQVQLQINHLGKSLGLLSYPSLVENYVDLIFDVIKKSNVKSLSKAISNLSDAIVKLPTTKQYSLDSNLKEIMTHFWNERNYKSIYELSKLYSETELDTINKYFEIGYSSVEIGEIQKGKLAYERYIDVFGENSAVLNNLANIYLTEGKTDLAKQTYRKALTVSPDDKTVINNLSKIKEREDKQHLEEQAKEKLDEEYKNASKTLLRENDYVLDKLSKLLSYVRAENKAQGQLVAIPEWMMAKAMQASKENSINLFKAFLHKSYLNKTNQRDQYRVVVYEINPYVEAELPKIIKIKTKKVDEEWINSFTNITIQRLDDIEYFSIIEKIRKINKKYSTFIERDFKELTLNYLMSNAKSTVTLSGSLIEFLLIYYYDKKGIKMIICTSTGSLKSLKKGIFKADLIDLISFASDQNLFGKDFPYLGNLLRVYRNLIHPGFELREGSIDQNKMDISFVGALEILKKVIN